MRQLRQCAALPYVELNGSKLVLLITTRGRGHWAIPKGWPKPGVEGATLAAREAFEEAGVTGEIEPTPIGSYAYTKRLHVFAWARCNVDVYALRADRQFLSWPEQASRRLVWVAPQEAADLVKLAQLKDLLHAFGTSSAPPR